MADYLLYISDADYQRFGLPTDKRALERVKWIGTCDDMFRWVRQQWPSQTRPTRLVETRAALRAGQPHPPPVLRRVAHMRLGKGALCSGPHHMLDLADMCARKWLGRCDALARGPAPPAKLPHTERRSRATSAARQWRARACAARPVACITTPWRASSHSLRSRRCSCVACPLNCSLAFQFSDPIMHVCRMGLSARDGCVSFGRRCRGRSARGPSVTLGSGDSRPTLSHDLRSVRF